MPEPAAIAARMGRSVQWPAQFEFVIKTHPGTPWARRAEYELGGGFGMKFVEDFRDPRYDRFYSDKEIKIPKL